MVRSRGTTVRALALVAATALAGCQPVLTFDGSTPTDQRVVVLTPDGGDRYRYGSSSDAIEVAALDGNQGSNLRSIFWPGTSPVVADGQSCATWTSQTGLLVQQGAALRIRRTSGRVRALTVTKNVLFGVTSNVNLHTWDSARAEPFAKFAGATVPGLREDGRTLPLPWRFCARVVGRTLSFKVWPTSRSEPAWGDPRWGGSATVPAGWEAPGTTGWYVGHLGAGERARYDQLRTWRFGGDATAGRPAPPGRDVPVRPPPGPAVAVPVAPATVLVQGAPS